MVSMNTKKIETTAGYVVFAHSETPVIYDGQSALEFAVNIGYGYECRNIAVNKEALAEDFFILSTGVAGEVVQKFVNYRCTLAIYGEYARYTSKPLRDFMYESNKGAHVFFVETKSEAIEKLANPDRKHF